MLSTARRRWILLASVLALSAWCTGEVIWVRGMAPPGHLETSAVLAALFAFALPLPLLLAPWRPGLAALAVMLLVLLRGATGYLAPGSASQSVVMLVALFFAEAESGRAGFPWRGAALGALAVGGVAAMDLLDVGDYAKGTPQLYVHRVLLVSMGVAAGFAMRDRRDEADRLEREVQRIDERGRERVEELVSEERTRIAAEVESAVALLLDGVRPRASRAAAATTAAGLLQEIGGVQQRARSAIMEMRRALKLLRAPFPDESGESLAATAAADRRVRLRRAAAQAAPVVLLGAAGIAEQIILHGEPRLLLGPEPIEVPAPVLGAVSPFVTSVVCVLPLLFRSRFPVGSALAVFALVIGRFLLNDLSTLTFTQFYIVAAAAFLGAAHARSFAAGLVVSITGVAVSVVLLAMEAVDYDLYGYIFALLLPGAGSAGGLLVRDRAAQADRERRAQQELLARHAEAAREVAEAERLVAARELHDVVGHAVTIIGVQSAVAESYAPIDLERARAAAAAVEQVAADVERDLARLTRVLDASAVVTPPPSVSELVERVRGAGLPVTLDQRVEDESLPLAVRLVVFRLVQEALTNVKRHAGRVPTTVSLAMRRDMLEVEVLNTPGRRRTAAVGGHGLTGMRERTELYGGRLHAGPDGDGRWRVRAELPLGDP